MNRWIVFNRFRTSDGTFFHVYVDAEDAEGAKEVAAKVFAYMAGQMGEWSPLNEDFYDLDRMDALRVTWPG